MTWPTSPFIHIISGEAEQLTGINYQRIHDAAIAGHTHWARYNTVPTFRVSQRDTIAWAANQKVA